LNYLKRSAAVIAVGCWGIAAFGQDIHFTQFNASPLTLNPSLTGKLQCTYRAALNFRSQWSKIPAPYHTFSAGFDAALWKPRLGGDAVGIGLILMNDVAGDGSLGHLNIDLSLAYHKALSEKHILSGGFAFSYNQLSLDFHKLIFANQIDAGGSNPSLPSDENFFPGSNYGDINAGLHYSAIISENLSYSIGGALYHVLKPVQTFLNNPENRVYSRFLMQGGFSMGINDQMSISPSFLYMTQGKAEELDAGASLGYHMEDASLYLGVWYRNRDAVLALVGLEIDNIVFGVSYDITVSDASKANQGQGAFELSLSYNGCVSAKRRITHCPRF
ncbi:MAG TPA: PorP/SprF family type IX secretion system membrane protein, partial [Geopsychrobacteraceae bacterium]